ncbi:MAG: pilus assembly protein TadB, partial [Acidimicrobiales bacterium]
MTALAALAGLLAVGGLMLAVSGVRPAPVASRRPTRSWEVDPAQLVAAVALAAVVLLVTRWPVAAVAAGLGGWFVAGPLLHRQRIGDAARAEAMALWVEMLRDAMGTARGVEGVLVATASTAPAPIRADVQRMARRLAYDPLDAVLDDLGDDLRHPIGDLVVTALRLASKAGARQTRDVLDQLAAAAYREA